MLTVAQVNEYIPSVAMETENTSTDEAMWRSDFSAHFQPWGMIFEHSFKQFAWNYAQKSFLKAENVLKNHSSTVMTGSYFRPCQCFLELDTVLQNAIDKVCKTSSELVLLKNNVLHSDEQLYHDPVITFADKFENSSDCQYTIPCEI